MDRFPIADAFELHSRLSRLGPLWTERRSTVRFGEQVMVPLTPLGGHRCYALCTLNTAEIARRATHQIAAVADRSLLAALWSLTVGKPTRWETIDAFSAIVLDVAPDGIVERDAMHVKRLLDAPLRIDVVIGDDPSPAGVRALSWFAADAPRVVVARSVSRRLAGQVTGLGIGVATLNPPAALSLSVPPDRRFVVRSARRWFTVEQVFDLAINAPVQELSTTP